MEFARVIITAFKNKNEAKLEYNWKLQRLKMNEKKAGCRACYADVKKALGTDARSWPCSVIIAYGVRSSHHYCFQEQK
jgi:hypothetical protein